MKDEADKEYCAEYAHGGKRWALNFFAKNDADADAKIESIKANLKLSGRLVMSIPVGHDAKIVS